MRGIIKEMKQHKTAIIVGAAGGGGAYMFSSQGAADQEDQQPKRLPIVVDRFPDKLSIYWGLGNGTPITLYQFESCPFCRKVRGVLDYHNLPYKVVEVHPLFKKELKEFAPDYTKVPILRVDGEKGSDFPGVQIRDSKKIIEAVMAAKNSVSEPPLTAPKATPMTAAMWPPPPDPKTKEPVEVPENIEDQWVLWTDKVLVQLIVINIYRSMPESAETFNYLLTHPAFSAFEKYSARWSGTLVMNIVARVRKKKFGVEDERQALCECLDSFVDAMGDRDYIGGKRPSRVDFNVYGILKSIEGFTTEKDMLAGCKIGQWYQLMKIRCGESNAENAAPSRIPKYMHGDAPLRGINGVAGAGRLAHSIA